MSEETMNMEAVDNSFETFKDADDVWEKMKKAKDEKTVLTVTVGPTPVKGGVVADVEGKRGFIPASQLALGHVEDLNEYSNKEIQVMVIDVDAEKKRLVLSARAALREAAKAEAKARLEAIEPGTILEGTVETIKPYGAFVKIDNDITGLVHVSQISVKRIKDPSDVLKEGETVKVKVLNVKDGKLSLSIKALTQPVEAAPEEEDFRNFKLPKAEPATSSLGDLLKGIKL